jgi:ABC-type transport system involved in Fe-S cluster assembly fused permease/ATPase subunit
MKEIKAFIQPVMLDAVIHALKQIPVLPGINEAPSALDNRTQAVVTRNLTGLKVTRILVAHRLSTIRNAHESTSSTKAVIAHRYIRLFVAR